MILDGTKPASSVAAKDALTLLALAFLCLTQFHPLLPLWSKNLPSLLIFNVHACVLALTFIMKNIKQKSGRQDCITHFHAPVAQLKKSLTGSRSCFSVSSTDFLSPVLF